MKKQFSFIRAAFSTCGRPQKQFLISISFTVLIAGCASEHEGRDLKRSGVVLYPVAKAGQAVGFLGQGVYWLSTPGTWQKSAHTNFPASPTADQRKELEKQCVFFERSRSIEPPKASGTGTMLFWAPIVNVLGRVEGVVGYTFAWYLNPNLPEPAMAFPGGAIVVNPMRLSLVSPNAQFFVLLHECGHHVLGHTKDAPTALGMSQPWLKPEMEYEADKYAAATMIEGDWSETAVLYAALEVISSTGDATHPPSSFRVPAIREMLAHNGRESKASKEKLDPSRASK